jgi:hypothetical protein
MEHVLRRRQGGAQGLEHLAGHAPGGHDAQDLTLRRQPRGQVGVGDAPNAPHLHTPERGVQALGVVHDLAHARQSPLEALFLPFPRSAKGGLGCGAQHHAGPVALRQLAQAFQAGPQVGQGQHLGLVQDDDALGQIVQLAAAPGTSREETLEKLDGGGDDDRGVPIFRGRMRAVVIIASAGARLLWCSMTNPSASPFSSARAWRNTWAFCSMIW